MLFQRRCFRAPRGVALRSRTDSGWSTAALAILVALIAGAVIAVLAVLGGARQTVASRSAAAFEEARQKGIPIAEGDHEHGAISPRATPGDHTEHRPSAAEQEPDHAGRGKTETAGHGQHMTTRPETRRDPPHAAMGHGTDAAGAERPAAAAAAGHAGHGAMPQVSPGMGSGAPPAPLAEKSVVARPGQPAATLEPDPLDAPAETSEMDAKRAAELAAQMGAGGHGMMHGTGSYRQIDAGREPGPTGLPTASPHHHGTSRSSMPAPTPTPDTKRPRPAATPVPTPGGHVHPGGGGK